MPYYPLQCTFSSCQMEFEHFTTPALYARSKADGFRDIRCSYCGSFGAQRVYPADSAPANITVKGTWGKHASPGLKGREFYTVQERDRQLASVGSKAGAYDGEGSEPKKPSSIKTYKIDKSGKLKLEEKKRPSEIVKEAALKSDGLIDFDKMVADIGITKQSLQGVILGGIRQGWIQKTETPRVYRLL